MRTLILAFTLLFGVLYVISGSLPSLVSRPLQAGFATIAIGENQRAEAASLHDL